MSKLTLKSEQQIVGDMARTVLARTGLNDLNPGSLFLTLLQAAAQEDYAQYYQMLQIIRNYNLDTTTGSDLDNRAFEFGLTRRGERATTGKVSVLRDEAFVKIATTFYTGFRSRIAGDTELFLNNAAEFPGSGPQQTIIIGRGTPNEEEVTFTPSGANPQNNTNYYKITIDVPLQNDHSLEEIVVLKQGFDIAITAGTIVKVPATARSREIAFTITSGVTLLAGEDRVDNVDVRSNEPGTIGNIGVLSITGTGAFSNPPFAGARAENDSAFSNGQDRESDPLLRSRIKGFIQAISQSTPAGIKQAINGLVDPATSKRVVSSNVILPDNSGEPVRIYIDDGTGFEPSFESQGQEIIIESASGGEKRLQLDLFPLVKAQAETNLFEPYDFSTNGKILQYTVGNVSESIQFFTNDFSIPEAATAEEVVAAINNKSNLLEARTSEVGRKIVIVAKSDSNESLQVTAGSANAILNFPTSLIETFYLYKNDKLLSKDGQTALLLSENSAPFDFTGSPKVFQLIVDGKTANVQTVTIQTSDFDSPAAASQASAAQAAVIINTQLAGATASDANGKLRIMSNTELSASSKLQMLSGNAQILFAFNTTAVAGKDQDYKLNPELGVIELTTPLAVNDLLTAGTSNTRAFLTASIGEDYTFAGGETLVVEVDGGASQTITFIAGAYSAQETADLINPALVGGAAVTRTVGNQIFLEIRTNTLDSTGSIEILSSSTANSIFGFAVDTTVINITPHTASQIAANSGPYTFIEGHTLVAVLDNDQSGKTYVITMDYDSEVTSGAANFRFASSLLMSVFTSDDVLNDFWVVMKSGANTVSGSIATVTSPSNGVYRYNFATPPVNFQDFAINDQASFSGMAKAANNGNFLVTGIVLQGTAYAAVKDKDLSNPIGLTLVTGDRYLISPDAGFSLQSPVLDQDIANPSALTPTVPDRYIVAPNANATTLAPVRGLYVDPSNPNVSTTHGYRYLINGTGVGIWAGHNQQIAQYNGIGTPGWIYFTPADKDVVFDSNTNLFYQFSSGTGTWTRNDWGGKAGKIAEWSGSAWLFSTPLDKEVRNVADESLIYQYATATNTWTRNDWGSKGNQIAQWSGTAWAYTVATANDTVPVQDESKTYQLTLSGWEAFTFWVEVSNAGGEAEIVSTGTGLIGQRRQVFDYTASTGTVVITGTFRATPAMTDKFIVLPGTRQNVVTFFQNTKVTSLSMRAYIELVDNAQKIQISSKLSGSDGYVQITGGRANDQLQFSNSLVRGLRAYSYYVGLVKLVHKTIYGDETDLVTFPGVGAAGIKFQILAPTTEEVPVSILIRLLEGVSLSSVENDVKSAVIKYVNSLGVSEEVILSRIVEKVIEVGGVLDAKITSPSANVDIAENELARTKASIISIN